MQELEYALQKDREDKLSSFRSRFYFPQHNGRDAIYFCGNSLGLQPRSTAEYFHQDLKDWQDMAIDGYWKAHIPWMTYPQSMLPILSRIVGAGENEVTVMNALTVNLHLLLLSFYRPNPDRYKIIIEAGAFPSDSYTVETQAKLHNVPADAIVEIHPREGEMTIRESDILETIHQHKDQLALVLLGGINYYTGQFFDIAAITAAAHQAGAIAGFDLAHAVGNAPLHLHDWDVDFAVWCSYKYLNGGPGAAGGAFIHERFVRDTSLVRLGGWWGNDEESRFNMEKGFIPKPTAEGWSMSTAQVFNMVALRASLTLFEEAGFANLQAKSRELTAYLSDLLKTLTNLKFDIITPAEPHRRGAQLSLYFGDQAKPIHKKMLDAGIVVDYRNPSVIRVAPAPLYNSFEDVYRFYNILRTL
ncbi:MAG: kynureninase [Bacteroidetes bacterium]|nr:kynureninase [Bacteroidota bacterium]